MTNKGTFANTQFSVLDLVPIALGNSNLQSMQNSLDLARNAENFGYKRFWVSEHHNTNSLVSSATVVLLGYLAQGTSTIRIGSGGVMLPNHAPLIVAEQFGTLETLYPNRIDLGLGRAPGTDQLTAHALRRGKHESVQDFPNDIEELQTYFSIENQDGSVRAIPGEGLDIPIYLLGSSTFSAQLAARKGLPYAFASHFAPTHLKEALDLYKGGFTPSKYLDKPYAMACVNVFVADSDEEAEYLATSFYQMALGIITNAREPLQPPVEDMDEIWNYQQQAMVKNMMYFTFKGTKETVEKELGEFIRTTGVDEVIVTSHIYDHQARIKSYRLLSELFNEK
ncbi:LLM class flavin-dependent oxidoreductase [Galbibacter sp.]|jgi:luciferase family oxidoreductase group 1|uniref:LLM class flavin-dependent oxidoreductase n=1 Tax=Galbibacter sp. TaxID=2918471 RepID=UPI003A8D3BF6